VKRTPIKRIFLAACLATFCASPGVAQDQTRRVIVEEPTLPHDFYRVAADKSWSGLPVPRFVSLKYNAVNGRQGPSTGHPVLWQYRRKGLPLIVVAETEEWRKVKDNNGDESWVRRVALAGTRTAVTTLEIEIRTRPREDANISAVADENVLLELGECNEAQWCQVWSAEGYKGWIRRRHLWGAQKL